MHDGPNCKGDTVEWFNRRQVYDKDRFPNLRGPLMSAFGMNRPSDSRGSNVFFSPVATETNRFAPNVRDVICLRLTYSRIRTLPAPVTGRADFSEWARDLKGAGYSTHNRS